MRRRGRRRAAAELAVMQEPGAGGDGGSNSMEVVTVNREHVTLRQIIDAGLLLVPTQ